jgi:glyoxylase I family protein
LLAQIDRSCGQSSVEKPAGIPSPGINRAELSRKRKRQIFLQVKEVGIMGKWCAFLLCFIGVAIGAFMNQKGSAEASSEAGSNQGNGQSVVLGLWGVRYQVKDVSRAIDIYTKQLGLKLDQQNLPAFAQVSAGNLKLILSGPGASGSRPMPDGRQQEPGGWNRIILQVKDLPARIEALKKAGLHFRNEMEVGPGGKQIQLEDPDGNPIELFEPASRP